MIEILLIFYQQWCQISNNTQEELLTEEGSIQITMASHYNLQVPLKFLFRSYSSPLLVQSGNPLFAFFFTIPQCHKLLWITVVRIECNRHYNSSISFSPSFWNQKKLFHHHDHQNQYHYPQASLGSASDVLTVSANNKATKLSKPLVVIIVFIITIIMVII